ncbi:MAG: NUDIX domain-containing protein [Kiritimatiellae bacterium]|nr:NUDIX domain-containing protein [Kiritimatiellia bacterium]
MREYIAQLNDAGGVTDKVERRRAHRFGLLHAEVDILVLNHQGLLLQQRKDTGKWCHFAGHVAYGESPRQAAVREFREEASYPLPARHLRRVGSYRRCITRGSTTNNRITTVFLTLLPIPVADLTPQPSEVLRIAYFSCAAVRRLIRDKRDLMAVTAFLLQTVPVRLLDCVPNSTLAARHE